MARIPQHEVSGLSDSTSAHLSTTIQAQAGADITLPGNDSVADAQVLREGLSLILRMPNGHETVIQNYFADQHHPLLHSANGVTLTPELVDSFVKPVGGVQLAQNGAMDDASPVGTVKEVSGDGTITHHNGTVEKIALGTPVYEGDIIETKAHGAVNITFADHTTFAVSENARLAIDEYVYNPATQSGENNFSVLRGVFVFTSGLIGRQDPDTVHIHTPVGSIGIRGTTIMGTINASGQSQVTVVEGAIVVQNAQGEQTLSQQFETVNLNGMNHAMTNAGVLDSSQIASQYNVLRTVSAPLFSTFDDMGKSAKPIDAPAQSTQHPNMPQPLRNIPGRTAQRR